MFKAILLAMSLVLSGSVFANDLDLMAVTDSALLGKWKSPTPVFTGNGMSVYIAADFRTNDAVFSSICEFQGGKSLEPSVSLPVNAGNGKIEILGQAKSDLKDGGYSCNVEISKTTLDYVINGNKLTLSSQGQVLELIRR